MPRAMARLTEADWGRLLPLLDHIKPARRQAAYNRLVTGMTLAKAGEPFGYSRQDVALLAKRVLDKHARLQGLPQKPMPPRGWVAVELLVPRRHVDDVRRVVAAMYPPPEPRSKPAAGRPRGRSPA